MASLKSLELLLHDKALHKSLSGHLCKLLELHHLLLNCCCVKLWCDVGFKSKYAIRVCEQGKRVSSRTCNDFCRSKLPTTIVRKCHTT